MNRRKLLPNKQNNKNKTKNIIINDIYRPYILLQMFINTNYNNTT